MGPEIWSGARAAGEIELKKNGKETLGDQKTQDDDYGEKWEAKQ